MATFWGSAHTVGNELPCVVADTRSASPHRVRTVRPLWVPEPLFQTPTTLRTPDGPAALAGLNLLVGVSTVLGFVMSFARIPEVTSDFVLGLTSSGVVLLLLMVLSPCGAPPSWAW